MRKKFDPVKCILHPPESTNNSIFYKNNKYFNFSILKEKFYFISGFHRTRNKQQKCTLWQK